MSKVTPGDFIKESAVSTRGHSVTTGWGSAQQQAVKPNILVVFTDQHRKHAIGAMNQDPVQTPNLDAFAAQGIMFREATSTLPVCSPFRATLLTGRYPCNHGVTINPSMTYQDSYLRSDETCIGDVVKNHGYATGYIGKWHLARPDRAEGATPVSGAKGDDAYVDRGPGDRGSTTGTHTTVVTAISTRTTGRTVQQSFSRANGLQRMRLTKV